MPNTYFQFRQFIVHQEKTAMKVCTDACLFGAWVAAQMQNEKCKIENVLDIGSGTGLLSLMLAQKTSAQIDAVEIDDQAYEQAKENFQLSPWYSRLNIHHTSIQHFNQSTDQQFNLIISNPPFFEQSLQSDNQKKNAAKHATTLTYTELINAVEKNLREDGKFYLLLPFQEAQKFINLAEKAKLFLNRQVHVCQTEKHGYFRTMASFSKSRMNVSENAITIKINNQYSPAFIELLKDYYLYL